MVQTSIDVIDLTDSSSSTIINKPNNSTSNKTSIRDSTDAAEGNFCSKELIIKDILTFESLIGYREY
jgi:hypothetical protein